MKKQIAVLGSTGSIGTQALEVIEEQSDLFEVYALTANNSDELLIQQARKFKPEVVVIANEAKYQGVKEALSDLPIKVFAGAQSIADVAAMGPVDIVLTAMVGYSGLQPTISALKAGKTIALANKETMVVAGELVCDLAIKNRCPILPVDSEHSAIFQCLVGETSPIERIILTASGGPFRGKDRKFLETVTAKDALKHPNWSMGAKVTIDSATMMNKGLELIEAMHLFGMAPEDIEILVHPQSIVHSAVEYADGAVIAQLGTPDMRLPIQYALTWPERLPCPAPRLDLAKLGTLTFEKPDLGTFRCLRLAMETAGRGMSACCAMNAANEIAVSRYLKGELTFGGIYETAASVTEQLAGTPADTLEEVLALDAEARRLASGQGTRQ